MSFKPFIAIGHGKGINGEYDIGCNYEGYCESEIAKAVVAGILEALDYNNKAYLTDYPDNDMNLIRSVEMANINNCSHYISIHLAPENADSGIKSSYITMSDLSLALVIKDFMLYRIKGLKDRGNILRPEEYELNATKMPSVVLEVGSIKADLDLITSNSRLFGHSIAYGIMKAAGEDFTVLPEFKSNPLYPEMPDSWNLVTSSGVNWGIDNILKFLNLCDYGELDINGEWGINAKQALISAQRYFDTAIDGVWGPITQAYSEAQIKRYQSRLKELGYYPSNVNGLPSVQTQEAVEKFQQDNSLEITGRVDSYTYAKLFEDKEDK